MKKTLKEPGFEFEFEIYGSNFLDGPVVNGRKIFVPQADYELIKKMNNEELEAWLKKTKAVVLSDRALKSRIKKPVAPKSGFEFLD